MAIRTNNYYDDENEENNTKDNNEELLQHVGLFVIQTRRHEQKFYLSNAFPFECVTHTLYQFISAIIPQMIIYD